MQNETMESSRTRISTSLPTVTFKDWLHSTPFLLMHLAVLAAFFVPFSRWMVALCAVSYLIRIFGITVCYHRYFSHRSYRVNRFFQFCLAFIGGTAVQKGALWWAANHRWHHRFSDQVQDVHSPVQRGFWWSHVGWVLSEEHLPTRWEQIQDLAKFPELRFLNHYHLVPAVIYATAMFLIGGLPGLVWGFVISTVLVWHGTFTINSLSHVWGAKRYVTTDESRNNPWLALLTFGEGWHNNHHCYQSACRQGFFWWEFDPGYYSLQLMKLLGIARDLRQPPLALLESKRVKNRIAKDVAPASTSGHGLRAQPSDRQMQMTIPLHEVARKDQPALHF
jgi:stearoyl-CoA desaturase (delta-9 desaturase)